MLGKQERARLSQQKEALVLESELNRVLLLAELQNLRESAEPLGRLSQLTRVVPKPNLLLLALAPVAGLLLARILKVSDSWVGRLASATKVLLPFLQAWKNMAS